MTSFSAIQILSLTMIWYLALALPLWPDRVLLFALTIHFGLACYFEGHSTARKDR